MALAVLEKTLRRWREMDESQAAPGIRRTGQADGSVSADEVTGEF